MIEIPEFKNQELRQQALTHRSYINENPAKGDNESLEFLGDAVLGFLVGELIYKRYKEKYHFTPRELTRLRSALVNEEQLAKLATQLGIGQLMRLGRGAEKDNGRQSPALLSDTFEAIIGAYFLDSGIVPLRAFIKKLFIPVADDIAFPGTKNNPQRFNLVDFKSLFQEWALFKFRENPQYESYESNDGKDSDNVKKFTAVVRVKGKLYGVGEGKRKQKAEKRAAEKALKEVGLI